jgi:hypothetical protein
MVTGNFLIPFTILSIKRFRTIAGCVIASFGVLVGMWLERFLIIVPSLAHKQLPYSWGEYGPRPVELTIMAATFAAMILLYTLFSKFVPIISIWELKAGDIVHAPQAGVGIADPHRIDAAPASSSPGATS